MADIVNERRNHQVIGSIFLSREMRRLQGVLELRNWFAEIAYLPFAQKIEKTSSALVSCLLPSRAM
jgi:hypothetical protein